MSPDLDPCTLDHRSATDQRWHPNSSFATVTTGVSRVGMSKAPQARPLFCYTGLRGVEKDPRAEGKIVHVRNDEYMS